MSRTPFSCLQEKVQENRGFSGLAFLPCGHGSVLAGVRSIRFDQCPRPEFLLHLLQSFARVQLLRVCRPQGFGRRRPSFNVPRLCRGVHRPAAAALRTLARGYVLGGWPGLWPAAAVARLLLAGSWPGYRPVSPRAAARAVTFFGPYFPGVAISSGFGAGRVASMSKTAAAQRILALLVRLYC